MTPPEGKPKFGHGGTGGGAEAACARPAGALWCAVLTRSKPLPMPAPCHRMPVASRRLSRRIGVAAGAIALLVQLVVVFAPMPPAASAGGLAALVSPHIG